MAPNRNHQSLDSTVHYDLIIDTREDRIAYEKSGQKTSAPLAKGVKK